MNTVLVMNFKRMLMSCPPMLVTRLSMEFFVLDPLIFNVFMTS